MESPGNSIFLYLITLVVDLYLFALLLRLLLQKMHGPFYNPASQLIIKVTQPVVSPLQRFLPIYHDLNFAIIFIALIIEMVVTSVILSIQFAAIPNLLGVFVFSLATLCDKVINILFFATLIYAILSWFPALQTSPITPIANCLATPLLNLARRFIPSLAGIDFSPLIILLALKLVSIVIFYPLMRIGIMIAIRNLAGG